VFITLLPLPHILAIDDEAEGVLAGHADGVWIVEPIVGPIRA
jgi:hypothetical protein